MLTLEHGHPTPSLAKRRLGRIVEGVSTEDRLEINWINSAGGALGAVSSAVVLSTFGAAGTLVGAAVGSLCITVGGAVYSHTMRKTKNRVAAVASHSGPRKARDYGSETVTPAGEPAPSRVTDKPKQDPERNGLPWKRIAVMTAALFAIAIAVILAFESFAGRPVSSYTGGTSDTDGGTTFSRVVDSRGGGDDSQDEEQKKPDQQNQDDEKKQDEDNQPEEEPAEPQQDEAPAPEPQQEEAPAPAPEPQP